MFTRDGGVVDPARERLAALMNKRRLQLGMRWREVAQRAGMTEQNLIKIRKGTISVTEDAAAGIERALRWQPGSVFAILAGDDPVPRSSGLPMDPDSRMHRATILNATPEQLVEMRQVVEDVLGGAVANDFLMRALELRAEKRD